MPAAISPKVGNARFRGLSRFHGFLGSHRDHTATPARVVNGGPEVAPFVLAGVQDVPVHVQAHRRARVSGPVRAARGRATTNDPEWKANQAPIDIEEPK